VKKTQENEPKRSKETELDDKERRGAENFVGMECLTCWRRKKTDYPGFPTYCSGEFLESCIIRYMKWERVQAILERAQNPGICANCGSVLGGLPGWNRYYCSRKCQRAAHRLGVKVSELKKRRESGPYVKKITAFVIKVPNCQDDFPEDEKCVEIHSSG